MKKLAILFFVLILILVGCSDSSDSTQNQSENVSLSEQKTEPNGQAGQGNLMLAKKASSVLMASTDDGFYQFESLDGENGRILYYDVATTTLINLSNQLIVTEDETNPGYLEDVGANVEMFIGGEHLYLTSSKTQYDTVPSAIIQMGLSGSDQKTIEIPGYSFHSPNSSGYFAVDGQKVYFITEKIGQDGRAESLAFCVADFETMEFSVIEDMPYLDEGVFDQTEIVGAYDDMVIFRTRTMSDDFNIDYFERLQQSTLEYTKYSLSGQKFIPIYTHKQHEVTSDIYGKDIYYIESGSSILRQRNLETEQITDVVDLKSFEQSAGFDTFEIYSTSFDGYLNVVFRSSEISDGFCYNLTTKELKSRATINQGQEDEQSLFTYGENKDYFIVRTDVIDYLHKQELDGTVIEFPSTINLFSLISKEDYWNNNLNYLPFEDTVYSGTVEEIDLEEYFGDQTGKVQR